MSDIDYQLQSLKAALAQEEEILSVISDTHNHTEVRKHVEQHKADIHKLEGWKKELVDWEKKQEVIRKQTETACDSGAPCGGA